jgi:hypothetical protein
MVNSPNAVMITAISAVNPRFARLNLASDDMYATPPENVGGTRIVCLRLKVHVAWGRVTPA